jgi:ABC-2 type transport system ATP-binding protein
VDVHWHGLEPIPARRYYRITVIPESGDGQFSSLAGNDRLCYRSSVALIELDCLTRCYGRRRGIEDVSLDVPEGVLFGFLGPNGAGKTTTIRVMLGFLRPSAGTAKIFGLDCWRESPVIKREIGYLPGDLRLPQWMRGIDALTIFGRVRRRDLIGPGGEMAKKFDFDLRVRVRDMSRGMRQKLGLILALAHGPRLLVLDEPTSSLDPLMQEALHQHLRDLAAAGRTVFFSSHSLGEVEQLCDRVAILRDGTLVVDESLEALRDRAGHDVTIQWKDDPEALEPPNFLKLTRREHRLWQGRLEGPVNQLVDFLANRPIEDLAIGRPDLESLFRRFYERMFEDRQ